MRMIQMNQELVNRLYHSFDNFKNDWMLDEYPDLKDDIEKQQDMYQWFKYYLQYLFGIGKYYVDECNRRPGKMNALNSSVDTIIESNTNCICDAMGLGIGRPIDNGFKFIDLSDDMIENDQNLELLLTTLKMTHGCDDQDILENLRYPYYNVHLK